MIWTWPTPGLDLLRSLNDRFVGQHADAPALGHATAYGRAVKLMRSAAGRAFNLDEEPAAVRDAYGRNLFGQGCLLARRLVEQGVPFIEVSLGGDGGNRSVGTRTPTISRGSKNSVRRSIRPGRR